MTDHDRRLRDVIAAIDNANACDPNVVQIGDRAVPAELLCRMVSSCRITPLMKSAAPGAVNSISR